MFQIIMAILCGKKSQPLILQGASQWGGGQVFIITYFICYIIQEESKKATSGQVHISYFGITKIVICYKLCADCPLKAAGSPFLSVFSTSILA